MRISDWSSDVCSSDLAQEAPDAEVVADQAAAEDAAVSDAALANAKAKMQKEMDEAIALIEQMFDTSDLPPIEPARLALAQRTKIGRASCRGRVCQYV